MAAVLPGVAGREPVPFDPHREIAAAYRARALDQVVTATELRAIGCLGVVGRGLLAPSPASPEKSSTREQPSRSEIQDTIEVAVMTLRVWRIVVVRGTPIVIRSTSVHEKMAALHIESNFSSMAPMAYPVGIREGATYT